MHKQSPYPALLHRNSNAAWSIEAFIEQSCHYNKNNIQPDVENVELFIFIESYGTARLSRSNETLL